MQVKSNNSQPSAAQAWLPDQADQGEFISSKYRIVLRRLAGVKVSPGSRAAY